MIIFNLLTQHGIERLMIDIYANEGVDCMEIMICLDEQKSWEDFQ
jgi:hypothetical protein